MKIKIIKRIDIPSKESIILSKIFWIFSLLIFTIVVLLAAALSWRQLSLFINEALEVKDKNSASESSKKDDKIFKEAQALLDDLKSKKSRESSAKKELEQLDAEPLGGEEGSENTKESTDVSPDSNAQVGEQM